MSFEKTQQPDLSGEKSEEVNPSVWQEKMHRAVDELSAKERIDPEEIVDAAFEHGILDRIAPEDEDVWKKRKEKSKRLYTEAENGTEARKDPSLYERIAYAVEQERYATKEGYTLGTGWSTGATRALINLLHHEETNLQEIQNTIESDNRRGDEKTIFQLLTLIQEKAITEAKDHGSEKELLIFPPGTKGVVQMNKENITNDFLPDDTENGPVTVENGIVRIEGEIDKYTEDGHAWFRPNSPRGHQLLYDLTDGDGLSPDQVRDNFEPKGEE